MRHAALLALALALPAPAMAEPQVFEMRLGGRAIGTLTYDASDAGAGWTTNLDNTPLGVADGVFAASSAPVTTTTGTDALRYRGVTETSRRNRVVEYVHAGGQVLSVAVTPDEDATNMSVADRVPLGILDPVEALGRFLDSNGCPAPLRIYDGRRVVDVTPQGSSVEDGRLVCDLDYTVVAGPGHLSPLGIQSLDVTLSYEQPAAGPAILREMDVRTGLLGLRVVR